MFYGLEFLLVLLLEVEDFFLEFLEAGFCVFQVFGFVSVKIGT